MKAEYDWEDKTIGIIKERLGVEEETDDDGDGEIEGDQNDNDVDDGGKTGDNIKKVDGEVAGGIINESKAKKEEDGDVDEEPQKHYSNRGRK